MEHTMRKIIVLTALLALFIAAPAIAHSYKVGAIEIGHAWSRATAPNAATASVYVPFLNTGKEPDTLTGADTPVASSAMLHETTEVEGVATMRMLGAMPLLPGKPVAMRPGGKHFMLTGLKQQLKEGDQFSLTLHFAKAGAIKIQVIVHAPGAQSPSH
jgi:periplasmic copper chaperone A